jgi:hypothetical protein
MDVQQTSTSRLQLIAPIGQDATGTYWRAVDLASGREVRAHELTGAYTEWRPALAPGYELVLDAGRVFIVSAAPAVPPQWSPSPVPTRGPRTGLVVGIVVAAVLAVVVLVGGAVVLLRGFAVSDGGQPPVASHPPAVVDSAPPVGPVNIYLVDVTTSDCVKWDRSSYPSVPDGEFNARIATCGNDYEIYRVLVVRAGVRRDEVPELSMGTHFFCGSDSGDNVLLIWASADGETGTMMCLSW